MCFFCLFKLKLYICIKLTTQCTMEYIFYILIFMILLHIIDDFVLQPICLSKLKCKDIWIEANKQYDNLYENDYKMALFIHGLSWSIMIHIPCIVYLLHININPSAFIFLSIFIHGGIHSIIDNLKANKRKINLITDQSLHFIQILIICTYMMAWFFI